MIFYSQFCSDSISVYCIIQMDENLHWHRAENKYHFVNFIKPLVLKPIKNWLWMVVMLSCWCVLNSIYYAKFCKPTNVLTSRQSQTGFNYYRISQVGKIRFAIIWLRYIKRPKVPWTLNNIGPKLRLVIVSVSSAMFHCDKYRLRCKVEREQEPLKHNLL